MESYIKLNSNRITDFYLNNNKSTYERTINEDDYIELRNIAGGSTCAICLIYHIEDEKLYAIKKQNMLNDDEFNKLKKRESFNYSKINHPLFPNFYGLTQEKQYLIFEYINGQTLLNTDISDYSESEKFSIIFQILSIFEYLHKNHFIYRDLNQNNIMIDSNKTAVLIDFDRMIKENEIVSNDKNNSTDHTNNFATEYVAPENQFILGLINYDNLNINIGIYWILESSEKGYINAYFSLGFLYQEGKNIKKDIKRSINYYKEASSFNNQFAKNNLGIIYKHGIDNEIEKNAANAEIYFSESIKQKNDKVSMYN